MTAENDSTHNKQEKHPQKQTIEIFLPCCSTVQLLITEERQNNQITKHSIVHS